MHDRSAIGCCLIPRRLAHGRRRGKEHPLFKSFNWIELLRASDFPVPRSPLPRRLADGSHPDPQDTTGPLF